jgi:hypothetical protein
MRILIVRLMFVIALVGLLFWAHSQFSKWLLITIEKQMKATFGGYYHLYYKSLNADIHLQTLNIEIDSPTFETDTSLSGTYRGYPAAFFKANRIEIAVTDFWQLLRNKKLTIQDIKIINPELLYLIPPKDKNIQFDSVLVSEDSKHILKELLINNIQLSGGSISVASILDARHIIYQGSDIQLEVEQIHLNSLRLKQLHTDSLFQNLRLTLKQLEYQPNRKSNTIGAASLKVDLNKRTLELQDAEILPHKDILRLSKEYQFQKTFSEIKLGTLTVSGLQHNDIFQGQIVVDKIQLDGANIKLMRNKNKPMDTDLKKPAFQDLLKRIGVALHVDTVVINNMHLDVGLLFASNPRPAHIKLSSITGVVYHLHNHAHTKQSMVIDIKGKVMKTATIHFKVNMPIHKTTHSYEAVITNMPLDEWNDVIGRVAPVHILSGYGTKLVMRGTAGATQTNGEMTFEYNDLKCEVHKIDKQGVKKRAKLKTLVANSVVKNSNPSKVGKEPTSVSYTYTRELYQGHEMLWIGGLIEGMVQTMLPKMLKTEVDKSKENKKRFKNSN